MDNFVKVGAAAEIPAGTGKAFEIKGKKIAVFNGGDRFYAIDDKCLHLGGPLSEGSLEGSTVTCPWHGWEYDAVSGRCITRAGFQLKSYQVKVEGGDVWIAETTR